MSLDGFVSSSAIFHDKDGTTTLKVTDLASYEHYTSGKMAFITGTCGTAAVTFDLTDMQYVMADGTTVGWSSVTSVKKIAFSADPVANLTGSGGLRSLKIASSDSNVSLTEIPQGSYAFGGSPDYTFGVSRYALFGNQTASFTVVVVGD